ncbi:hypothetical protein ACFQ60_22355 [Streptomyces zhihengii]
MAADEMQDTRTEAERLADALNTLNGVSISAAQSEIGFRGSLADLTATVKENGQSMDITSEAGRKVKGAFLDAADAAMEHAQAVAEQQGSVEAGNTALEKDIRLLRETMKAAGFGKEAIDQLTASYLQVPDTVSTRMDTNVKTAVGELEGLQQKIKNTKGKSVTLNALTATAEKNLKDLGFKVTHMKDGKVKVDLPTGGTRAAITSIQRWLDAIRSKTVTVTTRHVVVGSGAGARQTGSHGTSLREADGGLVEFYAGGGVRRENHIAQIARGGTWRVWAEDETQGESYIPHARSKWPRSRLIAEETVRRLGGKGVAWNANGSVSGASRASHTPRPGPVSSAAPATRWSATTRRSRPCRRRGPTSTRRSRRRRRRPTHSARRRRTSRRSARTAAPASRSRPPGRRSRTPGPRSGRRTRACARSAPTSPRRRRPPAPAGPAGPPARSTSPRTRSSSVTRSPRRRSGART